ncbi:MAG: MFS transporter [Candidatus Heimdallarchaeota archaeon]|nr:MFS transporter [Candidatus Heimdallarchaeota archaeon]
MSQKSFPYIRTALLSLGFFTNNLTWSVFSIYVPIFLRREFISIFGDISVINTLVGLIMVLDNIAAILIQPYIGQLSDRTWIPKLGRRMPYIIIGIPLAAFFFGLIGTFESTLILLLIAICGFNVSMAFYRTPVMSLVPDYLSKEYRSQGSGVLNIVGGVASITGLFVSSYLYQINHTLSFWIIGAIMIVCLIILFFTVREHKEYKPEENQEKIGIFASIKMLFKGKERNVMLLLVLGAIFFHISGYQVAETYISSFVSVVLGLPENQAGFILGAFIGFQIIAAFPAGIVGRKIGPLNACLVGIIGFSLGLAPITISSIQSTSVVKDILFLNNFEASWLTVFYFIEIIIMGFSWLLLSINVIVVIWDMTPARKIATYTGYYYLFSQLAAIVSPFLAGGVFDLMEAIFKLEGLRIFFLYISCSYLIALIFISIVKHKKVRQLRDEHEKEQFYIKRIEEKQLPLLLLPKILFGFGIRTKEFKELKHEQKRELKQLKKEFRKLKKEQRGLDKEEIPKEKLQQHQRTLKKKRRIIRKIKKRHKRERQELKNEIMEEDLQKQMKGLEKLSETIKGQLNTIRNLPAKLTDKFIGNEEEEMEEPNGKCDDSTKDKKQDYNSECN